VVDEVEVLATTTDDWPESVLADELLMLQRSDAALGEVSGSNIESLNNRRLVRRRPGYITYITAQLHGCHSEVKQHANCFVIFICTQNISKEFYSYSTKGTLNIRIRWKQVTSQPPHRTTDMYVSATEYHPPH